MAADLDPALEAVLPGLRQLNAALEAHIEAEGGFPVGMWPVVQELRRTQALMRRYRAMLRNNLASVAFGVPRAENVGQLLPAAAGAGAGGSSVATVVRAGATRVLAAISSALRGREDGDDGEDGDDDDDDEDDDGDAGSGGAGANGAEADDGLDELRTSEGRPSSSRRLRAASWGGSESAKEAEAEPAPAPAPTPAPAPPPEEQPPLPGNFWSGFHNKTLRERQHLVGLVFPHLDGLRGQVRVNRLGFLPNKSANVMVENCVGVLGVPLGIAPNFVVDGRPVVVPMAVEEPSVIAAASGGAKLISQAAGGFSTSVSRSVMTAQIQVVDLPNDDAPAAAALVQAERERLVDCANTYCESMRQRGGGVVDLTVRVLGAEQRGEEWAGLSSVAPPAATLVVHIEVDVCEAMGANVVNTVAEGVAPEVARVTGGRVALRILSQICARRMVTARFRVPLEKLAWKGVEGAEVARRVVEAFEFADADPFRAATNNKGIMNGVDAVAVATGQDFRAIEAGAHAYAARSGRYRPLSRYRLAGGALEGELELPLAVGTKGGALHTHPGYMATLALMGDPDVRRLSGVMVATGLAQNFSALRALAVTGIQEGHMALHARNIASAAGAPAALVPEVCAYMLSRRVINVETANEYLRAHALYSELQAAQPAPSLRAPVQPSTLFIELPLPHLTEPVALNVAMRTLGPAPVHLSISASDSAPAPHPLQAELLGDFGYQQLTAMFFVLDRIRLHDRVVSGSDSDDHGGSGDGGATAAGRPRGASNPRANVDLQQKLKLVSLLINVLVRRLGATNGALTDAFVRRALSGGRLDDVPVELYEGIPPDSPHMVGLPLLTSLFLTFQCEIDQFVAYQPLAELLMTEQRRLLRTLSSAHLGLDGDLFQDLLPADEEPPEGVFERLMLVHAPRWQATVILLIEALGTDSGVLTPGRLGLIQRLGGYLEWEGTLAHDVSFWRRDLREGRANAFLFWARTQHVEDATAVARIACGAETPEDAAAGLARLREEELAAYLPQFWAEAQAGAAQLRESLASASDASFDVNGILDIVPGIQMHYGVSAGPGTPRGVGGGF